MAQWVGGQVKVAKNTPTCGVPHRKRKIYFFSTTRLAESIGGLNSSLAQSPGELYDCKVLQEKLRTRD